MGQIKNIKLHIVTDIKIKPIDMPLFKSNSFKASGRQKVPKRAAGCGSSNETLMQDDVLDNPHMEFSEHNPVKLSLGDNSLTFRNGDWEAYDANGKKLSATFYGSEETLREKLEEMEEENMKLKLKLDILLDMLAVSHCDNT